MRKIKSWRRLRLLGIGNWFIQQALSNWQLPNSFSGVHLNFKSKKLRIFCQSLFGSQSLASLLTNMTSGPSMCCAKILYLLFPVPRSLFPMDYSPWTIPHSPFWREAKATSLSLNKPGRATFPIP